MQSAILIRWERISKVRRRPEFWLFKFKGNIAGVVVPRAAFPSQSQYYIDQLAAMRRG